eukprot:2269156-Rhodomonas_salina.2
MVAMQDVDLRTEWGSSKGQGMFGSCLGPMLSSLTQTVGGMSFCKNIFTGGDSGRGWVSLAPSFPGTDLAAAEDTSQQIRDIVPCFLGLHRTMLTVRSFSVLLLSLSTVVLTDDVLVFVFRCLLYTSPSPRDRG